MGGGDENDDWYPTGGAGGDLADEDKLDVDLDDIEDDDDDDVVDLSAPPKEPQLPTTAVTE